MNESNMPREWWHEQDLDEAWMQQLEDELQRREAEERAAQERAAQERAAQESNVPVQLELPFYETDIDEGPFAPIQSK